MKSWTISEYTDMLVSRRPSLQRLFFTLALISLGLNLAYHLSVSQIGGNPLAYQDLDPVYLLAMYFGLPQIAGSGYAPVFDTALIISCAASAVWTRQRFTPILFFILHFFYFLLYNLLAGHHYISIGLLFMAAPFIFRSDRRFAAVFLLCRYLFCFMMFSAALWKLCRGDLWHTDQAGLLLIDIYLEPLARGTTGWKMDLVRWLIDHRYAAAVIWPLLIGLEGIFLAGFFHFRWDGWLLLAYLLFFGGGWLIFGIYNYDNLLFLLTLVPVLRSLPSKKISAG